MKRIYLLFIPILILATSCGRSVNYYDDLEQLSGGKTFAVPTGTVADQFVMDRFPDAHITYYNTVLDCALAVNAGMADATVYDLPVLKNITAQYENLHVLDEILTPDSLGFAVHPDNYPLKEAIDVLLSKIRADGTYQEMLDRWIPEEGEPGPMPDLSIDGTDGVLRFGTAAVTVPLSYVSRNNEITGFDIELARRIANSLNKRLEIINMEFGAMLPALIAGRADMVGAGMSITEERAKRVLFSDSYYDGGIAVLVNKAPGTAAENEERIISSLDDLHDKKLGVLMGSIYDAYAEEHYPTSGKYNFNAVPDMLLSLSTGRIDAAFVGEPYVALLLAENPQLDVIDGNLFYVDIAAGFNKQNPGLRLQFNEYLAQIRNDGTYEEIMNRWIGQTDALMPDIIQSGENGQLRVGVVSDIGLPFTAMSRDQFIGLDIEIANRFAAHIGKRVVFVNLPFSSLLPSLSSGRIDMIAASMMVTEERARQIDFSDPYLHSGASVLIRGAEKPVSDKGLMSRFENIGESFYSNIIHEQRYLLILNGLYVTVLITILSAFFGTMLGGVVCAMRMSKNRKVTAIASAFIAAIRGTPVLVLLMIIYYVIFASINISAVLVAVIGFGVNFAAYVSEMFRTSIESIDKGQTEAGTASGFTRVQTFLYIIMPQALRRVLPVYKGEFISLLKMTSIVGYIAVQDLTKASDIIRSRTFDAFFPLIMVAVIYFLLAWSLGLILDRIEINVDPKRKRRKIRKEVLA